MTATPLPNAKVKFWDRDGNPLAGGKLYTYVAGSTNTNKTTWKDANKVATNTNPVILDAYGEADIWLDGNYKINLTDSNDVDQWDAPIDNVSSFGDGSFFLATTGTGNAYVLTPSPAISTYDNAIFTIIPNFTNSAPATINISGLGTKSIKKEGSTALVAGDIVSGRIITIGYDGTNFQILETVPNPTFATLVVSGTSTLTGLVTATAGVKIPTGQSIKDGNGNELVTFTTTPSATNELTLANAATGNSPILSATGGDTNIGMHFQKKGGGQYVFYGASGSQAILRLREDTANGTNQVGLKAPGSIGADIDFELPSADGSSGQALTTNGSAVLSFNTINPYSAQSLAAGGYTTFVGGLKIQWGITSATTGNTSVTFPSAFASAVYSVTITAAGATSGTQAADYVSGVTTSGFTLNNQSGDNIAHYWMAIGQ